MFWLLRHQRIVMRPPHVETLSEKVNRMLALLQSLEAKVDTLTSELANTSAVIQANAAAKAELDASAPVIKSIITKVDALDAQFAVVTAPVVTPPAV